MDSAIAQWISIVTAGVAVAAIVAVATILSRKANKSDVEAIGRSLAGKASKADVDKDFGEVQKKFEAQHLENKTDADESLRQYRELQTVLELLRERIVVLDKNSLTKSDLLDMKADIKEVINGLAAATKSIDGMPDRLVSLEATRNREREK